MNFVPLAEFEAAFVEFALEQPGAGERAKSALKKFLESRSADLLTRIRSHQGREFHLLPFSDPTAGWMMLVELQKSSQTNGDGSVTTGHKFTTFANLNDRQRLEKNWVAYSEKQLGI